MNTQRRPSAQRATPEQLSGLAPLGALSAERLRELAGVAIVEFAARGSDPLALHGGSGQSVFLLHGELLLMYAGGGTLVVVGGMGDGRHPLNRRAAKIARFERVGARHGEVVIREGGEGDYYYVIESGRCQVERMVGGVKVALAELKSGDTFGEEALASEARRNATVTMATDGKLLRLGKKDFHELLGEPLLQRVGYAEGLARVAARRALARCPVPLPSTGTTACRARSTCR